MSDSVIIHFDGGNPPDGSGCGVYIPSMDKRYGFAIGESTNNVAEYEALIAALSIAMHLGIHDVKLIGDSELVVRQMVGRYACKDEKLIPLYQHAKFLSGKFRKFEIEHTRREGNGEADKLATRAARDGEVCDRPSTWIKAAFGAMNLSRVANAVAHFSVLEATKEQGHIVCAAGPSEPVTPVTDPADGIIEGVFNVQNLPETVTPEVWLTGVIAHGMLMSGVNACLIGEIAADQARAALGKLAA